MEKLSLTILLCLFFTYLSAQNPFQVKGVAIDSAAQVKLHNATISILNSKDSTLYKFVRASENGDFHIGSMRAGNFILLLTYAKYADYVYNFKLDSINPVADFKVINMKLMATLLNEVLIKGRATAITIKGDTTEFNASSYTIQPNDKVEDLLKKLPGIQIDNNGKITARGKDVPKILIDGEEFFSDDPLLVTRNVRADMVDKVQLYEKKSDQATFTGIDDGVKTQTINIKLKEDKKNGYFGKADLGAGTDDFYQAEAMFNKFTAKQKMSVYAIAGNNGKTGLDGGDAGRLGANNENIEFMDGGSDRLDVWGGRYDGEGIPTAFNSGAHYDNKWNKDKQSINANYKIGSLSVDATKNTINQNNLPTGLINSNSDQHTNNYMFRQNVDAIYAIKLDTTSNLKITFKAGIRESDTENRYSTISKRKDNTVLNTGSRLLSNNGKDQALSATAFYTKQLKKKGRTLSLNVNQVVSNADNNGYLNAKNDFFTAAGSESSELIDQFKISNTFNNSSSAKATYTEPVSSKLSMILNYAIGLKSNNAERKSFNASAPGRYDILDAQFSNHYKVDQFSNQGGASFNYSAKKTTLILGTQVNHVNFNQLDVLSNTRYNRNFLNWIPQARYQYRISPQKGVAIGYNGRTSQPSVTELQPVLNNNDPLNIPLGNPNLRPSYSNSFNLSYESYKAFSNQLITFNGSYTFTSNAIVSNRVTDPATGATIFQSINLTSKTPFNYNIYSDLAQKIKLGDIDIGLIAGVNGGSSFNYINNAISKNKSASYAFDFSANKTKERKYDFYLAFGPSYNIYQSSLQPDANNNGWGYHAKTSFKIFLPGKIEISSDLAYERGAKTQSFDQNFEKTILNSTITKKFLKTENLKMTVSGNDLFNQNIGFYRYANENMLSQTSYNTIKRYFMYSITWDFNRMGGIKK